MPLADMLDEKHAREVIRAAFAKVCGPDAEPSPQAIVAIQSLCRHESQYARGWAGAMIGSNNYGAFQGSGNAGSSPQADSHADGAGYVTRFARYATEVDGAAAVVNWFWRRPNAWAALDTGDAQLVAAAMHDPKYPPTYGGGFFEGRAPPEIDLAKAKDDDERAAMIREKVITDYADALYRNAKAIAAALNEELWLERDPLGCRVLEDGRVVTKPPRP